MACTRHFSTAYAISKASFGRRSLADQAPLRARVAPALIARPTASAMEGLLSALMLSADSAPAEAAPLQRPVIRYTRRGVLGLVGSPTPNWPPHARARGHCCRP